MNLKQYYGKKVKIVAANGMIFLDTVNDYFFPEDNEAGKESIAIDTIEKQTIEFNEESIQKIELIK